MADKQNLGQQRGMHEDQRRSQQSPGRNPQDDRSAGDRHGDRGRGDYDPSRGGDGGPYRERDRNETRR